LDNLDNSKINGSNIDRLYRDAWIFNETVVLKLFWIAFEETEGSQLNYYLPQQSFAF